VPGNVAGSEILHGTIVTYGMVMTRTACSTVSCFVLQNVSKLVKNVRLDLWFDDENVLFSAEFMLNILVK
jgi:hypothetical protein